MHAYVSWQTKERVQPADRGSLSGPKTAGQAGAAHRAEFTGLKTTGAEAESAEFAAHLVAISAETAAIEARSRSAAGPIFAAQSAESTAAEASESGAAESTPIESAAGKTAATKTAATKSAAAKAAPAEPNSTKASPSESTTAVKTAKAATIGCAGDDHRKQCRVY
jgi:hypothetical protein